MKLDHLWSPGENVAANARSGLPMLAGRFFTTGSAAAEAGTAARKLHRFRIAAKRFRYTLELFREIYGPRLEVLIAEVRKVQDFLGARNHSAPTLALLPKEAYDAISATLDARAEEQERLFRAFWSDHFGDQQTRQRWLHYLTVYPGRTRPNRGQ